MSKRHLVFGIALLIMITAAPGWSTYIPTYSDGKYKGCTYYNDDGEPIVTYLKVSLLNCIIAGIIVAVIIVWILLFCSTLSRRAFSTLINFPRIGRIAWNLRSRPCFADPPAESPSTIYNSVFVGSRSEQSASFPGNPPPVIALLRTVSRAFS